MANIKPYTDQIQNAVYGEEVRGSIINALNKVNDDNNSYTNLKNEVVAAKNSVDSQVNSFDNKVNTAKSTLSSLNSAVSTANTAESNLTSATSTANTAKSNLDSSTTKANGAKAELDNTIKSASTAQSNLQPVVDSASNLSKTLNESTIESANAASSALQSAISGATPIQEDLSEAIERAKKARSDLNLDVYNASTKWKSRKEGSYIKANTDLNLGYLVSSEWTCPSDDIAKTLKNCPTKKAFKMSTDELVKDGAVFRTILDTDGSYWMQKVERTDGVTSFVYGTWRLLHQGEGGLDLTLSDQFLTTWQKILGGGDDT